MLPTDGMVAPGNRVLDVAEQGVDPVEFKRSWMQVGGLKGFEAPETVTGTGSRAQWPVGHSDVSRHEESHLHGEAEHAADGLSHRFARTPQMVTCDQRRSRAFLAARRPGRRHRSRCVRRASLPSCARA